MNTAFRSKQPIDVTIVTVCYNALDYLRNCIASVLSQNSSEITIEHILIDGNSTDGTQKYLQEVLEKNDITSFISEPDHGIYDAMNKGLALAQGNIIAFLNADDEFLPGAIKALAMPILENEADYTIGTARVRKKGKLAHHLWPDPNNVYMGAIGCHQTLFCKTDIIRTLGGFEGEHFPTIADAVLMANLAVHNYRFHEVSGEHVIFTDGGASTDCLINAADQYAQLIAKYWRHLRDLILANPEHFYRVRWDIIQKIDNIKQNASKHAQNSSLLDELEKRLQELEALKTNNDEAEANRVVHRKFAYILYRLLSKISFGKKKLYFLQKKYFAKQKIKWHRI